METGEELFKTLMEHKGVKIERIVSYAVREGQWYDQAHDEWVMLLHGSAVLEFQHSTKSLSAGDYCFIPAHKRHRVKWTSEEAQWLAVHWDESKASG